MRADQATEDRLRALAPQVLGALVRRYGHEQFDSCEDAVQEALLAAAQKWPGEGLPDNPRAWLVTVAARRLIDEIRSEHSRRRRELRESMAVPPADLVVPAVGEQLPVDADDTLLLLFLCCHPALTSPTQIALTLRAVGGLSTAQIATAFLVPEATMAQRISRAKQRIREAGAEFTMPPGPERAERLNAVLHVLYLVFNEGYTASSGADLHRTDLTSEAVRLARELRRLVPDDPEVAGLLALMLLTDARRTARTDGNGDLVPLDQQDRARWDQAAIREGVELVTAALAKGALGPYQVQAAIAAVHDEAKTAQDTDWPQILGLYEMLERIAPNPMVTLNRVVALAEVHGPQAGLDLLATLDGEDRLARHHRVPAVRAHLLEAAGELAEARETYLLAARRTNSLPERRYLEARARRLGT